MKKVGNIYVIAATAVIGGALFGFDISSMSAIISTQPYRCQFNRPVSETPSPVSHRLDEWRNGKN